MIWKIEKGVCERGKTLLGTLAGGLSGLQYAVPPSQASPAGEMDPHPSSMGMHFHQAPFRSSVYFH